MVSDHDLMVVKLHLKLLKFADNNTRGKYNVNCLKESDHKKVLKGFKFCNVQLAIRERRHY